MADTKITALTAITTVDPANDVLPIVDVSDTSMAASGTTKKITTNQILGASGTATLASATITGDLTVDTNTLKVDSANNRVGIGTASPSKPLEIYNTTESTVWANTTTGIALLRAGGTGGDFYFGIDNSTGGGFGQGNYSRLIYSTGAYPIIFSSNASERYRIASDGVATWSNVGGVAGTAMTLNSTGLGVGRSPISKLTVDKASQTPGGTTPNGAFVITDTAGGNLALELGVNSAGSPWIQSRNSTTGAYYDLLINPNGGNVGIGVTPSAWGAGFRYVQAGPGCAYGTNGSVDRTDVAANWYYNGGDKYINATGKASIFQQSGGAFFWLSTNTASGGAGSAMSLNTNMTLDASGNLLVGTTSNTNASRVFSRGTATSSALALQGASGDVAIAQLTVGKFDNNSTTSQIFVRFTINDNSGGSGQINANGASQAAFGSFSDSRLKENIVSLPSQLANILSLRPVEFDYKDGSGHQIGFVAQEMQEVYSDAVGEQNGFLTVTGWSKTEARLVSAIKELAAKVQALEAKLA